MRYSFAVASLLLLSPCLLKAQLISPTECSEDLFKTWPTECRPYSLTETTWTPEEGLKFHRSDQVRCHFSNQLTAFVFKHEGVEHLDVRGLKLRGQFLEDEWFSNQSCQELVSHLEAYTELQFPAYRPVTRRDFQSFESVAVLASVETCSTLATELEDLRNQYHLEGRTKSEVYCVPEPLVRRRNPSEVREWFQQRWREQSHIMIVGRDIPPFELYARLSFDQDGFDHGVTDLPYGNFSEDFWSKPRSKYSSELLNKAFHEKGNMYLADSPTPFAFDVDAYFEIVGAHAFEVSVSRWIASSKETMSEEFYKFLERRKSYLPADSHRITSAEGSVSFMYRPLERIDNERHQYRVASMNLKEGDETQSFSDVALDDFILYLDQNTTFLDLSEHGHPSAIGSLHSQDFAEAEWLPEILHIGSCFSGSWMLTHRPGVSLIDAVFSHPTPSLAVLASQGLKSYPTMGKPGLLTKEIFASGWREGQSLGDRQLETVLGNTEYILGKIPYYLNPRRPNQLLQILSMTAIFGDGTVEF